MNTLGGLLGIDLNGLAQGAVAAAGQIFVAQTELEIALANLQAERQSQAAAQQAADSSNANVTLLVTGGLVLAGGVLAIRALRKS